MTDDTTGDARPDGLRELKKQATRRAIHHAALGLAAERGIDGVTVGEICAAAEVSQRTFFNYYPSKAAAVLGMTIRPLVEEDRSRFLSSQGDLMSDLCGLVGSHVDPSTDVAGLKRLAVSQPGSLSDLGRQVNELCSDLVDLAARRGSDPRRSRLAVSVVMAALKFILHSEQTPAGPQARGDALRDVVREIGELAR